MLTRSVFDPVSGIPAESITAHLGDIAAEQNIYDATQPTTDLAGIIICPKYSASNHLRDKPEKLLLNTSGVSKHNS